VQTLIDFGLTCTQAQTYLALLGFSTHP